MTVPADQVRWWNITPGGAGIAGGAAMITESPGRADSRDYLGSGQELMGDDSG